MNKLSIVMWSFASLCLPVAVPGVAVAQSGTSTTGTMTPSPGVSCNGIGVASDCSSTTTSPLGNAMPGTIGGSSLGSRSTSPRSSTLGSAASPLNNTTLGAFGGSSVGTGTTGATIGGVGTLRPAIPPLGVSGGITLDTGATAPLNSTVPGTTGGTTGTIGTTGTTGTAGAPSTTSSGVGALPPTTSDSSLDANDDALDDPFDGGF